MTQKSIILDFSSRDNVGNPNAGLCTASNSYESFMKAKNRTGTMHDWKGHVVPKNRIRSLDWKALWDPRIELVPRQERPVGSKIELIGAKFDRYF